MSIDNFDPIIEKVLGKPVEYRENEYFLPSNPFRQIICGQTGCGKTTVILNQVFKFMDFDKLIIVAKQLNEMHYEFIKKEFEEMNEARSKQANHPLPLSDILEVYDNLDELPAAESLPKDNLTRVVIFDDFINERDQTKIIEYFTAGRKKGCTCIYIAQRYTPIPSMIRANTDFFLFYQASKSNVTTIYNDIVDDMEIDKFRELFNECTRIPHSFLTINRKELPQLKYRKGFTEFLCKEP